MNKKIMKRSLALGALMAFVITGNAFADKNLALKGDITVGEISLSSHSEYVGDIILGGVQYGKEDGNETNDLGTNFKNLDTTMITIIDGSWDDVTGGNQSVKIFNSANDIPTLKIGTTNVTVTGDGTIVKRAIGGSRTIGVAYMNLETTTTNVNVGEGVTVKKEVIGGDYIKGSGNTGATGCPSASMNSSVVTNTNVVIDGATVNGHVFGGSVAHVWYPAHGQDIKLSVQNENVKLFMTNATVNANVFGAGGALYTGCSSSVTNVDMDIIGGTYKDIYSGGLLIDTNWQSGLNNDEEYVPAVSVGSSDVNIKDASITNFYAANSTVNTAYTFNGKPSNDNDNYPEMDYKKGEDFYTDLTLTNVKVETTDADGNPVGGTVDVQIGTVKLMADKETDMTRIGTLAVGKEVNVSFVGSGNFNDTVTGTAEEKAEKLLKCFDVKTIIVTDDSQSGDGSTEGSTDSSKPKTETYIDAGGSVGKINITTAYDDNGNMVVKDANEEVNISNAGITDMANLGLISWRAETNDMNKRMGELRNANGEHGVWVRMVRGEDKYGSVKNQYNQYQLGYDEKLSVDKRWTVGAALSYTDAKNTFSEGTGESTNKALSIYGSKLNDDGTFVDLIAKYARLENDFVVAGGAGNADYSTNGYSFSAEFGKRIQQGGGVWIEPQVELTYGKVAAVDYVSKNGVKVAQDGMESIVGRVGFSLGKDIKQGNIYARASYLYDFDGETKGVYTDSIDQGRKFEDDLGGGWFEVGIGTNINLSKSTYIYADVEKTFGGEVDTNWQWNLGVRYSF